jgi:hypothetical protein
MSSAVADVCAGIERAFGPLGVRWYVFGAQAAILFGVRRLTADIDVTVDPGGRATTELVAALAQHGFELRVQNADEFIRATRVVPLRHAASGFPVDLVLAGPGFEDRFFARAITVTIGDVRVPVPRVEDVIVMKVLAGRPKDVEDVVSMLVANDVDVDAVRADLRELEQLLDQSDLTPVLEAAVRRADRAR